MREGEKTCKRLTFDTILIKLNGPLQQIPGYDKTVKLLLDRTGNYEFSVAAQLRDEDYMRWGAVMTRGTQIKSSLCCSVVAPLRLG